MASPAYRVTEDQVPSETKGGLRVSSMKWSLTKEGEVVPIAVRIDLPFCLYLENGTYVVDVDGMPIQIDTEKIWRNSEGSSDDDAVADQQTFFTEAHLIGGPIGGDPAQAAHLVAKNMEFAGDRTGYFRYTRMAIGLTYPADTKPHERGARIAQMAVDSANTLIDSYRYASGRAYVPRVRVADLRFMEIQYPLTGEVEFVGLFTKGLRVAVVNDSKSVHAEVRSMAEAGETVPIHADLLLAAIRALWETDFRLAAIEAFAALEVFVDNRLYTLLFDSGAMNETEFDDFIYEEGQNLAKKMKKPLRRAGVPSPADNTALWEAWIAANKLRNRVVHTGYQLSEEEARSIVRTVQQLLEEMGDEGMHLAEEMPA